MDKYTFGDSKAAVNLVKTLNELNDPKYSSKVATILDKYIKSTGYIMFIPNNTTRQVVLDLWHERFIDNVNSKGLPEGVRTHTLCVGATVHRKLRKLGLP